MQVEGDPCTTGWGGIPAQPACLTSFEPSAEVIHRVDPGSLALGALDGACRGQRRGLQPFREWHKRSISLDQTKTARKRNQGRSVNPELRKFIQINAREMNMKRNLFFLFFFLLKSRSFISQTGHRPNPAQPRTIAIHTDVAASVKHLAVKSMLQRAFHDPSNLGNDAVSSQGRSFCAEIMRARALTSLDS